MAEVSPVFWTIAGIIGLFYIGSFVKIFIKLNRACMICLAVSLSWIILLALRYFDIFSDQLILGILLGESVVGGYYLWERRVKEEWLIFRLPVLLSLTFAAYIALSQRVDTAVLALLAGVWLLHSFLYFYRRHPGIKTAFDRIVTCCSRW